MFSSRKLSLSPVIPLLYLDLYWLDLDIGKVLEILSKGQVLRSEPSTVPYVTRLDRNTASVYFKVTVIFLYLEESNNSHVLGHGMSRINFWVYFLAWAEKR